MTSGARGDALSDSTVLIPGTKKALPNGRALSFTKVGELESTSVVDIAAESVAHRAVAFKAQAETKR